MWVLKFISLIFYFHFHFLKIAGSLYGYSISALIVYLPDTGGIYDNRSKNLSAGTF